MAAKRGVARHGTRLLSLACEVCRVGTRFRGGVSVRSAIEGPDFLYCPLEGSTLSELCRGRGTSHNRSTALALCRSAVISRKIETGTENSDSQSEANPGVLSLTREKVAALSQEMERQASQPVTGPLLVCSPFCAWHDHGQSLSSGTVARRKEDPWGDRDGWYQRTRTAACCRKRMHSKKQVGVWNLFFGGRSCLGTNQRTNGISLSLQTLAVAHR